ncbi:MAG: preprotein translocase subunit YajC [Eubacteriales bacterium]|nr:preprotein translocase subunit YajC [Eubacteriales bacterium]
MPEQLAALLPNILIIVAFIAVFYFMIIRPQSKQRKAREKMLNELKVGDRVKSIGGIYGRISALKDNIVTVEVGHDRVKIVFDKSAISAVEGGDPEAEEDLNA